MKQQAQAFFLEKLRRLGDTDKRIFSRPDLSEKIRRGEIKKVHLTGICGTAMSSLAGLFAESGFEVSGSDTGCYPPTSDLIKRLGITFYEGFSEEHVKDKDLYIVANMFGPDNVEAAYVRNNNLPQLSMPEAIAQFFIKDKTSIAACGTHGKTTTTGIAAHVFMSAGYNPGFLIGGVAVPTPNGISETNFYAGNDTSRHFIIEGDEYDTSYFDKAPKFLHYKPNIAIVTSLEFDHADIYKDFEEYKQSFVFLAEDMPEEGLFVLNGDLQEVRELANHTKANVLYYGFNPNSDITAKDIRVDADGQHFELIHKGQSLGQFTIGLFGRYNLANALAVSAAALHEGVTPDALREGLATFLGMKRRQEIRAIKNGITVIDDFAHHPTAVRQTLGGIRERFPERRIIALFEPRSVTSRKKLFEADYGHSFESADCLYLSMPALRVVDNPADFIDGEAVVGEVKKTGKSAFCVKNGDEALEKLVPELKSGDVIVIMSNGSFDGVHEKLIKKL